MAFNYRMLGPVAVAQQTRKVHGRSYTAAAGAVLTVPEQVGEVLKANGWVVVALSGPTSARPSGRLPPHPASAGSLFWDETLAKLIVHDGATWRDPSTGSAV